jgi:hypothetical protein
MLKTTPPANPYTYVVEVTKGANITSVTNVEQTDGNYYYAHGDFGNK